MRGGTRSQTCRPRCIRRPCQFLRSTRTMLQLVTPHSGLCKRQHDSIRFRSGSSFLSLEYSMRHVYVLLFFFVVIFDIFHPFYCIVGGARQHGFEILYILLKIILLSHIGQYYLRASSRHTEHRKGMWAVRVLRHTLHAPAWPLVYTRL